MLKIQHCCPAFKFNWNDSPTFASFYFNFLIHMSEIKPLNLARKKISEKKEDKNK